MRIKAGEDQMPLPLAPSDAMFGYSSARKSLNPLTSGARHTAKSSTTLPTEWKRSSEPWLAYTAPPHWAGKAEVERGPALLPKNRKRMRDPVRLQWRAVFVT